MNAPGEAAGAAATPRTPRLWAWLLLAGGIVIADQLSKSAVLARLAPGDSVPVSGYANLVLAFNRGAAFSFLNNPSSWQGYVFVVVALAASAFIVSLLARGGQRTAAALGLAFILGGALGNVADRLRYGHVVDFLDFHWPWLEPLFPGGHFPAFNLADSAITAGVALLIVDELARLRRRTR